MTTIDNRALVGGRSRRPVQIYAGVVGLLGLDLLLLPAWIAPLAFADPALAGLVQIDWLLRGLGGSCLVLAAILMILARTPAAGIAPLLAFAAGVSTLALLAIGWGHLSLAGEGALLLIAASDIGFGLWMRRALGT